MVGVVLNSELSGVPVNMGIGMTLNFTLFKISLVCHQTEVTL